MRPTKAFPGEMSKNTRASGAGGTGRGRALGYNANIGFTIEFENGVRQIVTGNID